MKNALVIALIVAIAGLVGVGTIAILRPSFTRPAYCVAGHAFDYPKLLSETQGDLHRTLDMLSSVVSPGFPLAESDRLFLVRKRDLLLQLEPTVTNLLKRDAESRTSGFCDDPLEQFILNDLRLPSFRAYEDQQEIDRLWRVLEHSNSMTWQMFSQTLLASVLATISGLILLGAKSRHDAKAASQRIVVASKIVR